MSKQTIQVDDALYEYLLSASLREPDILRELRKETAAMPNAGLQISPEQGQLMNLLARLMGARRYLEIGVFTGYSSLAVALALPEDGLVTACDLNADYTRVARRYWEKAGLSERITLKLAPALDSLDTLLADGRAGFYDLAFIDADKANYLAYFERCLELLRPGGLIAVDNTLWSGRVLDDDDHSEDTDAIRLFNQKLHEDQRIDLSLVPIGDGLTLARKRS